MILSSGAVRFVILIAAFITGFLLLEEGSQWKRASTWQRMVSPGALSLAHADLDRDCAACHTSVQGIDPVKCVVCHASDQGLLQRQPTSFHADITSCHECHPEHSGADARPTRMDHEALSSIGLEALEVDSDSERIALYQQLMQRMDSEPLDPTRQVTRSESVLACNTCHANEDVHFELMGNDCAQCHATSQWTLPEFRHPSSKSRDCAQCHQAPPSHYMMHFKMVSASVARKPHAEVGQCFECHRTTAWTDIPGIGHYKHH